MTDGIEESQIQCDERGCNFITSVEWDNVPDWHNAPCPSCSKGVLINDADLAMWNIVNGAVLLTKHIDPDGKLPREHLLLDTSVLRAK